MRPFKACFIFFILHSLHRSGGESIGSGSHGTAVAAATQEQHGFQQLETMYGLESMQDGIPQATPPIKLVMQLPSGEQQMSGSNLGSSKPKADSADTLSAASVRTKRRSRRRNWVQAISRQLPSYLMNEERGLLSSAVNTASGTELAPTTTPAAGAAAAAPVDEAVNVPTSMSQAATLVVEADVATGGTVTAAEAEVAAAVAPDSSATNSGHPANVSIDSSEQATVQGAKHQLQQQHHANLGCSGSSANSDDDVDDDNDDDYDNNNDDDDSRNQHTSSAAADADLGVAQSTALDKLVLPEGVKDHHSNPNFADAEVLRLVLHDPPWNASLNALLAGGKVHRPGHPLPGFPAPFPTGPRPPCNSARGVVEQSGMCVCKPGYGPSTRDSMSCVKCLEGWVSSGGPVDTARCTRCPQGTTSNEPRTACALYVHQPNVNDALCKPCYNRLTPFLPPACCGKGQVCCGDWGCCAPDRCFNNATFGNQPYCCAVSNCTADPTVPGGCCPTGSSCVALTVGATGNRCCPLAGQCIFGTSIACCDPVYEYCYKRSSGTTTVTVTAECCHNTQQRCEGEPPAGRCCSIGQTCVGSELGQRCCNSPKAELCFSNSTTASSTAATALQCCEPPANCLRSPITNLPVCCSQPFDSVCGRDCCQLGGGVSQCLYGSICCATAKVCRSLTDSSAVACCSSAQTCRNGICVTT